MGFGPFVHLTALEEAEIIPGEHSDTRIKPLNFANGHGRYNMPVSLIQVSPLAYVGSEEAN